MTQPQYELRREDAFKLFQTLADVGYAVALKHRDGKYYVDVPVRLSGDPAYKQESEIMRLVARVGLAAVQTGPVLRIVGK